MSIASIATLSDSGANDNASSSSWNAAVLAAQLDAGNSILLALATDNVQTTDGNTSLHTSVSVGSLSLTKLREFTNGGGAAAAGGTISLWLARATANIAQNTAIAVSLASAVAAKALTAWEFSSPNALAAEAFATDLATTSNAASQSISGLASKQYLFCRTYSVDLGVTGITPTSGWTGMTVAASSGGAFGVRGEFQIATATGATSTLGDSAGAGEPRASIMVALDESIAPQIILPDGDLATTGWTTAPLFSKLNDASDATVVTGTLA